MYMLCASIVCFLLLLITASTEGVGKEIDPCQNSNHDVIDDEKRSAGVRNTGSTDGALDDRRLVEKWYRFNSSAGAEIPNVIPGYEMCHTVNPIWMKGNVPANDGLIHDRTVCVNNGLDCCNKSFSIQVKNCGSFPVYKLKPAPVPFSAYCAGQEVRCPTGTVSPTGFTPCGSPPHQPTLQLEETNTTFAFRCQLTNPEPWVRYTVRWLTDDNVFLKQQLQVGEASAVVMENQLYYNSTSILGTHVSCQVGLTDEKLKNNMSFLSRATPGYFLGLKIVDLRGREIQRLSLDEDSKDPVKVFIKNTVPVKCNTAEWSRDSSWGFISECSTRVGISNPAVTKLYEQFKASPCDKSLLATKPLVDAIQFSACDVRLKGTNWKEYTSNSAVLIASNNHIFGTLTHKIDFTPSHFYQSIWSSYSISLEVSVVDTTAPKTARQVCRTVAPGRINTYDGTTVYPWYQEGEFVLYESTEYNIRVHVFKRRCGSSIACICGIAAQAEDDVIIVDRCRSFGDIIYGAGAKNILRTRVIARGAMASGFDLVHTAAPIYTIKFPHGALMKLTIRSSQWIQFELSPSQLDYNSYGNPPKVRGLCGTFSRDNRDDMLLQSGKVTRSLPEFLNDWQIQKGSDKSMYNGHFVHMGRTRFEGQRACSCVKESISSFVMCTLDDGCSKSAGKILTARVVSRTGKIVKL